MGEISSSQDSRILILDGDYLRMEETIETILKAFPLPWEGRRVLIKPNMLGPNPPEKGITTHPSIIRALVRSLRKRGATCAVGDNPGMNGYAANHFCAEVSGILDASEGAFINLARQAVCLPLSSRFIKTLTVSKAIREADLLINVPKFKTHLQTRITGAIKNMFGIVPGAEKARVHLRAPSPVHFSEALVDIYQIRIPDLTILDAVVGMEGNGPSSRDLRPIGKILAGSNGVALDALMAWMMGVPPGEVDMLRIAAQRGLGEIEPRRMDIQGQWAPLKNFRMPLTHVSRGFFGSLINRTVYRPWVKPRFRIDPEICNRCGTCVDHCPVGALAMKEIPQVNREKCIACYCCLELCPHQAMELTGFMKSQAKGRNA
jgi:uncharacterized protein (DUF362 family)/ferredoxin